jgi:hypothetical protein
MRYSSTLSNAESRYRGANMAILCLGITMVVSCAFAENRKKMKAGSNKNVLFI